MSRDLSQRCYFSFFMFTANLQPGDPEYAALIAGHMKELRRIGYAGFDLPIAPTSAQDHCAEVESYRQLRKSLDDAGLADVKVTTNVGATRTFDPTSPYAEQRAVALDYLKSRVDITRVLRADVMAGPIVLPYGLFPTTDANASLWSDDLHAWLVNRYRNAQPVIQELASYAAAQNVKLAIEPVDHWETPAPNLVSDLMTFLERVPNPQVGACVDSAHVVLGSDGPSLYDNGIRKLLREGRLHYVHLSAPDRGALRDSWIPWKTFLLPIAEEYDGPYLVEVFNAIPVFLNSLRITRRKFWIPGEDSPVHGVPDAYTVAREALDAVLQQFESLGRRDAGSAHEKKVRALETQPA